MILIVDDDEGFRGTVREALEGRGYRVLEAANGIEALDILKTSRIHVVICDLYMPQMDGIAFLQRVREMTERPPIIAITGEVHPGAKTSAATAALLGASGVLIKPFSADELVNALPTWSDGAPSSAG